MPAAPQHICSSRSVLPWLPLPAILGFALFGVGGSVFLAYTTSNYGAARPLPVSSSEPRIYEARAVPFDSPRETPARRAAAISRVLAITEAAVRRAEPVETERPREVSQAVRLADAVRPALEFPSFRNFDGGSTYFASNGVSHGIAAQSAPSVFMGPDAETVSSSVPEVSTWMCGAALFVLVAARGIRARWHRNRPRE